MRPFQTLFFFLDPEPKSSGSTMKLILISFFDCLFEFVKIRFDFCVSTSCFLLLFLGAEMTANVSGAADDDGATILETLLETLLIRDDPAVRETGTNADDD